MNYPELNSKVNRQNYNTSTIRSYLYTKFPLAWVPKNDFLNQFIFQQASLLNEGEREAFYKELKIEILRSPSLADTTCLPENENQTNKWTSIISLCLSKAKNSPQKVCQKGLFENSYQKIEQMIKEEAKAAALDEAQLRAFYEKLNAKILTKNSEIEESEFRGLIRLAFDELLAAPVAQSTLFPKGEFFDEFKLLKFIDSKTLTDIDFFYLLHASLLREKADELLTKKSTLEKLHLSKKQETENLSKTADLLYLLAVKGFSKAAVTNASKNMIASPLYRDYRYHRSQPNNCLMRTIYKTLRQAFDFGKFKPFIVGSANFPKELMYGKLSADKYAVKSLEELSALLKTRQETKGLQPEDAQQPLEGLLPKMIIDISPLIEDDLTNCQQLYEFIDRQNNDKDIECFAIKKVAGITTVLTKNFSPEKVEKILSAGYQLSPNEAIKLLYELENHYTTMMNHAHLPITSLATKATVKAKGVYSKIDKQTLSESPGCFQDFINSLIFKKFESLSLSLNCPIKVSEGEKVIHKAIANLMRGFEDLNIDDTFKKLYLESLLWQMYYGLSLSMVIALRCKETEDHINYHCQIEFIHQIIQDIIAITMPYASDELEKAVVGRYVKDKILPKELLDTCAIKVNAKASAMRALQGILTGVEQEVGSQHLNIAVQKDSYYENQAAVKRPAYSLFDFSSAPEFISALAEKKVDLFLCEFRHNIIKSGTAIYKEEDLRKHIEFLYKNNLTEKLTVVIDTTLSIENSYEIKALLSDPFIIDKLKSADLNLVLLRSAQKFDMLGIDNYYGGISISIHALEKFEHFNQQIDHPEDRLQGLDYQGLTHLQKYAGREIDNYRKAIYKNTEKVYQALPKALFKSENLNQPLQKVLQITEIEGQKSFLDIRFRSITECFHFRRLIEKYAKENHLVFSDKPSFGFMNTNMTCISGENEIVARLTFGVEGKKELGKYIEFFEQLAIYLSMPTTLSLPINLKVIKKAHHTHEKLLTFKKDIKWSEELFKDKEARLLNLSKDQKNQLIYRLIGINKKFISRFRYISEFVGENAHLAIYRNQALLSKVILGCPLTDVELMKKVNHYKELFSVYSYFMELEPVLNKYDRENYHAYMSCVERLCSEINKLNKLVESNAEVFRLLIVKQQIEIQLKNIMIYVALDFAYVDEPAIEKLIKEINSNCTWILDAIQDKLSK